MTDLKVTQFKVKKNLTCDMCGEEKATLVIMDPNKFPDNDLSKREDYLDVCEGCREFVNVAVSDEYKLMACRTLVKGGMKVEDIPDTLKPKLFKVDDIFKK